MIDKVYESSSDEEEEEKLSNGNELEVIDEGQESL